MSFNITSPLSNGQIFYLSAIVKFKLYIILLIYSLGLSANKNASISISDKHQLNIIGKLI